jgi:hypothetical protein
MFPPTLERIQHVAFGGERRTYRGAMISHAITTAHQSSYSSHQSLVCPNQAGIESREVTTVVFKPKRVSNPCILCMTVHTEYLDRTLLVFGVSSGSAAVIVGYDVSFSNLWSSASRGMGSKVVDLIRWMISEISLKLRKYDPITVS